MKKVLVMVALVMASVIVYAFNDSRETNQGKKEVTGNGEVVVMDKEMFLKDVFELAALFNATSIPLFVFIPMKGDPQLFRGAADKATYKKAIDEFLLK